MQCNSYFSSSCLQTCAHFWNYLEQLRLHTSKLLYARHFPNATHMKTWWARFPTCHSLLQQCLMQCPTTKISTKSVTQSIQLSSDHTHLLMSQCLETCKDTHIAFFSFFFALTGVELQKSNHQNHAVSSHKMMVLVVYTAQTIRCSNTQKEVRSKAVAMGLCGRGRTEKPSK